MSHDANEYEQAEEELLKTQKLESIGMLAIGVAHDFNGILTAITGNLSLAEIYAKEGHSSEKVLDRLRHADKAVSMARDLVRKFLTFFRDEASIQQTVNIAELLEDVVAFTLKGFSTKCVLSIPDNLWLAEIDKTRINQVINNLIINSQQAMPEGGTIEISAENIIIDVQSNIPLKPGKYIAISVKDEGIGIKEEHIKEIFEPFFSTKPKGSGLGLAISHLIIKKHKGHIAVISKEGVGTTFRIYLLASSESVPEAKIKKERKPIRGQGRILVMDDEKHVRDTAAAILSSLGYRAITAIDGAEAIEIYEEARNSENPFDSVIIDLTVPGGMGGKETIQRLVELDPDIKAIVCSGYSNDPIMANYQSHNFKGVIAKPYKTVELSEVLNNVISGENLHG